MALALPLAAGPGLDLGDPYALGLLLVGLSVLVAIGALTHEHGRAFSSSVVYVGLGLLAAAVIGLLDVDWLTPTEDAEVIERVTELAVIVALFATGLRLDRSLDLHAWGSVARLIGLTMPITIAALAGLGSMLLGLPPAAAILLGAALAPTDPVLAGDVGVGPPGEEHEREPNFAITTEAGLNDGLAFPFVILALFVAERDDIGWLGEWLLADVLYAVVVGVALGGALGWGLAALIVPLRERGLVHRSLDGWIPIASVLAIYGATELVSAYGFLAAFAGGLGFRRFERNHEIHEGVHRGIETAEKALELGVILLLGSLVTLHGLTLPGLRGWAVVVLLLLVVRPVAVALAFVRSPLDPRERLFLAWFGVRGIGSAYYAAAALSYGALHPDDGELVFWTVIAAILASVVAHGITGSPVTDRLVRSRRDA